MRPEARLTIAVFGLGEAGSLIAGDLAAAGATVRAFDPAPVPTPPGVTRVDTPGDAIPGAQAIMAITAAADAHTAMDQGWDRLEPPVVYADLATGPPGLKEELANTAAAKDASFADVALMAPVPGRGLSTPALVSGTGATRYAAVINGLGGQVEVVGDEAGQAAARKLMRSVVTKGLTALLIEALELAAAAGDEDWLWGHITDELASLDVPTLTRLLDGTARHAGRRQAEMEAVRDLLDEMGVPAPMTTGTISALRRVSEDGMPDRTSL
ncbi:MAG: DUF1932 domain-containing protein [Acidimicrobiia bacterium]